MTEDTKNGTDVASTITGEVDYWICGDQIDHNTTNAKYREATNLEMETSE